MQIGMFGSKDEDGSWTLHLQFKPDDEETDSPAVSIGMSAEEAERLAGNLNIATANLRAAMEKEKTHG